MILACFTSISAPGTIQLATYPGNYEINADCSWLITAGPGQTVDLTFTVLDTEQNGESDCTEDVCSNCPYDHVDVYSGTVTDVRGCH